MSRIQNYRLLLIVDRVYLWENFQQAFSSSSLFQGMVFRCSNLDNERLRQLEGTKYCFSEGELLVFSNSVTFEIGILNAGSSVRADCANSYALRMSYFEALKELRL